jgi:cyclopropane-fatty-acyl-phospholipid synthase
VPRGVAATITQCVQRALRTPLPVGVRAWDGSRAVPADVPSDMPADMPADVPTVVLRSPRALRRLLTRPGELGLARAYICGDLDVEGDPDAALRRIRQASETAAHKNFMSPGALLALVSAAAQVRAVGLPPQPPTIEARVGGRLHSRRRDRAVIAHHYDTSNEFYELLLGKHLAYSCAYWTPETADADLDTAQRAKFDLVCRKLGLVPGMRLLDIGCGWGGLAMHAAVHYGVHVVGVTLSGEQLAAGRARVRAAGLDDVVDLRLLDYRDLDEPAFDAISTIEMGEHVGARNYPRFAATLHRQVRPGGRVLVQQMSRHGKHPGGGPFIERYVAPDMYMRPVGQIVELLENAGLEVRDVQALRENYTRTINEWRARLEARWDDAVGLLGAERARMWRLYLLGSALAFEQGRMGVDQILAVRTAPAPDADAPALPQR